MGWIAEAYDPRAALATGGVATIAACAYGFLSLRALKLRRAGRTQPDEEEHPELELGAG
ncbi:MAG: hypothetical protein ABR575_04200 [Actinomycetota bacterium]